MKCIGNKIKTVTLVFVLLFTSTLASDFHNEYNHHSRGRIKRLKVCGERCSGTNFIWHLLHRNFPYMKKTDPMEFGHKHFLWWFGTPSDSRKLSELTYAENAVDLSGSKDCLFVVVVRDPYDWLRSFYLVPWHVHRDLTNGSFFDFISSEWKLTDSYPDSEGQYSEIDNENPWTGRPFSHILELRKCKNQNYLNLGTRVKNFLLVKYDDVRDNPEAFVKYVAKYFRMRKWHQFVPVDTFKGSHVPYVRKKYFPIEPEELEFINSEIDWETEAKIGFFKKSEVKYDETDES